MCKVKKKILLELSSTGHYPSKFIYVSEEEKNKLLSISRKEGMLCCAKGEDLKFVNEMMERKEVDIPMVTYYI